ncbi:hypothetical protein MN116_003008 [Schistosoma mekongi]|uniref:Uncharacterized protein n=1 Tax=Schistosoma mekongi TaxID=38744 RepID=A0AAE1ZH07_SCHME|nr:hypothetical protein MN116_003008 [Schistosoma mekongi]
MHTDQSTECSLIGFLLILTWLHEREILAFSSKGLINYDISTAESEDTMKSPIFCLNQNVYDCSLSSELKFTNSVLFQNNIPSHNCDILNIDANQDLLRGVEQCVGILINMNNTGKTSNYQIWLKNQDAVRLSVSKNVIYENLLTTNDISQSNLINETTSTIKFHYIRNSGIHVTVELSELNFYPAYEDVTYDGVNDVILNATPGTYAFRTYAFRLKKPLMEIAKQFCRYPLPSRYLLSLKAFRRRQTYGYKRNCRKHAQMNATYCLTNKHENYSEEDRHKKYFYERSLNDQCGRNQAAILPDNPNSFYCTYDTPLINELFGEYVNEQILQSNISLCDTYENLCFKCLNSTIENAKTDLQCSSKYVNINELSEINVNYDESESNALDAQCCRISCYNTPACLSYYSSTCQSSKTKNIILEDKVCMDGNTFQISITPEYDFHNGTFMCHLRQINNSFGFQLKFSLNLFKLIGKKSFHDQFNTQMLLSIASQYKINSVQKSKLIIKAFGLDISLNELKQCVFQNFKDVILVGRKVEISEGYEFFVHQAPSSSEIENIQSPVEHVLHTDSAFTTLQSNQPHAFSSINWKEKGCVSEIFQNIRLTKVSSAFYSKGYPADIYAISNVKTDLAHSMSSEENNIYWNKQHKFQLYDKQTNLQRINIMLSGNFDIYLYSIF